MIRPARHARAALAAALAAAVALSGPAALLSPAPAQAASVRDESGAAQKTVRVAYFSNDSDYQSEDENGVKSGWGYEYLQTLSYYTGWKYEYVYGDFATLMEKLQDGQIDLMANVSYTPERAEKLLFSTNPQGKERYYLFVSPTRDDLAGGDYQALQGTVVGVIPDMSQSVAAQQKLAEEGIDVEYRDYDTSTELFDALAAGQIDAAAMNDSISSPNASPAFYVGESNYYLAVPKSRPDLLADANTAMARLQMANPGYTDELKVKYTANGGTSGLSSGEERWLAQRSNTISIGYIDHTLPYANTSADGELEGSLAALVSELEDDFGAQVRVQAYPSHNDLYKALLVGDVDVAAPVVRSFARAEASDLVQTDAFASTAAVAVYRDGELSDALGTIATYPGALINNKVLGTKYPDSMLVACSSLVGCVDAVATGRAGATIIPLTSLDTVRSEYDISDLKTAELPDPVELNCWLRKGEPELLSILNKAIANSGDAVEAATLSRYSYADAESPLLRFYKKHQVETTVGIAVVLGGAVLGLANLLRRARKAEAEARLASNAKSDFLARMSHDIRTPLNGIIGLLEISSKHPDDPQLTASNRAKARVAADHLLSLVNDVLEMSKLEDGKVVLEDKPFNLVELSHEVYVIGQLRASDRGVTMTTDAGANLRYPNVYGSPLHVRRVLLNLVDNCVKYNRPGGTVSCTSETVGEKGDVVTYRLRIADTGIGMSEEFQKHVFEPFAQERDGARSSYQGTGMGMPIVKRLVEQMGGTIGVESELGVGTTFTVELPLRIDRHPELDAPRDESCDIAGMSILLAEDNDLNAEIACALLSDEGVVVTRAADGREAVDIFEAKPAGAFDAILMDIMMPELDGYEATRAIRVSGKQDAQTIPIVAMTANAFADDVRRAKAAGMNDHLAKPIDVDKIKHALAKFRA